MHSHGASEVRRAVELVAADLAAEFVDMALPGCEFVEWFAHCDRRAALVCLSLRRGLSGSVTILDGDEPMQSVQIPAPGPACDGTAEGIAEALRAAHRRAWAALRGEGDPGGKISDLAVEFG